MLDTVSIPLQAVEAMALACLGHNGCDDRNAQAVASVIVAAEADGCPSHGLFRLPGYVASLRSGKVNGKANPRIVERRGGFVRVDGDSGFAPLAHLAGQPALVETAHSQGVGVLALVNMYHFSALWIDLEPICSRELCAFAFTSYLPVVAPAGGTKPLFGTNPMAFGLPRQTRPPMIFDQASSVMARGEVMLAAHDGHRVKEGVGIDATGAPTTDPHAILGGAMLPFGGYKGSAIALMVELVAGALIGEQFSFEAGANDNADGGPPRGGELVLAISPLLLSSGRANWRERGEAMFAELGKQSGAQLSADRRYANRVKSQRDGVTVKADLVNRVRALYL
jgi:delta1-piperideine-2-carboxylate reductase